jgi:hypothetical protein
MLRRIPRKDPPAALVSSLRDTTSQILSDTRLRPIQGMTLNLLYRAQLRNRDQDFLRTLGQLLASRRQEDGLREELWNYTHLYDAVIGTHDPNQQAEYINRNHPPAPFNRAKFSEPDLTDWIFTIQSRDATETNNAIHK